MYYILCRNIFSIGLTSMFMTFPFSVLTLVLFDSLWKLQVEFIKMCALVASR